MTYQQMHQMFINGQITQSQWVTFCQDYFLNVVLTDPVVVGVMVRLKDR
jgi:hypothetical protein